PGGWPAESAPGRRPADPGGRPPGLFCSSPDRPCGAIVKASTPFPSNRRANAVVEPVGSVHRTLVAGEMGEAPPVVVVKRIWAAAILTNAQPGPLVNTSSGPDQKHAHVHDVGVRQAGAQQVARGGEEGVTVVAVQEIDRVQPLVGRGS